jgi:transposase
VTRKALIVRPHLACGDEGNQSVPLAVAFLRGKEASSRGVARKQIVLKHDPKAWEEGFKAGESRVRIPPLCPYAAGTTQAWSWHSGHVEGDAKRQGYSYSRGALSKGPPSRGPIIV